MDLHKTGAPGKIKNKIDQQKKEKMSLLSAIELKLVFIMLIISIKELIDKSFARKYLQISY
jgi:hypothetical protein